MKKNIITYFNRNILSHIKQIMLIIVTVFVFVCLLAYPSGVKNGISSSLKMCGESVIPSLFPFLFVSSFITESGIFEIRSRVLERISERLFSLSLNSLTVFILSALGGFPVGAKAAAGFLEKGKISESEAKRLVLSCVNPAPAFAVCAVGLSFFSDKKTGVLIYISVILSNFIILFLTKFIFNESPLTQADRKIPDFNIASSFVSAGAKASAAIISICCYVLLFSCLCEVMKEIIKSPELLDFLCGICEVTEGGRRLSAYGNIPLVAGIIGWGGLSVHCQIMDSVKESGVGVKLFFVSRAVCAFLCVLICDVLLKVFPVAASTMKINGTTVMTGEKNPCVSIMLLLTCFVFLAGDCRRNVEKAKKI